MTSSSTLPIVDAPAPASPSPGKARLWIGRILSGLIIAFLALDAVMKFVQPAEVIKGTQEVGFAITTLVPLGIILLGSVILYAIPRTAVLGAILLTAYLGGAVATHVRMSAPMFSHTLFPVYFGIALWGGLYLRNPRIAAVLLGR